MDFILDAVSVEFFKGVLGEAFQWQVTQTTLSFLIAMWLAKRDAKKGLDKFFERAAETLESKVADIVKKHFEAVQASLKNIGEKLSEVSVALTKVEKESHRRITSLEESVSTLKTKIKDWENQSN